MARFPQFQNIWKSAHFTIFSGKNVVPLSLTFPILEINVSLGDMKYFIFPAMVKLEMSCSSVRVQSAKAPF